MYCAELQKKNDFTCKITYKNLIAKWSGKHKIQDELSLAGNKELGLQKGTQEASTELIMSGSLYDMFTDVHLVIVFGNLQVYRMYSFVVSNIT